VTQHTKAANNFNCFIETEGLLKVTSNYVHCKGGDISETVQDSDVVPLIGISKVGQDIPIRNPGCTAGRHCQYLENFLTVSVTKGFVGRALPETLCELTVLLGSLAGFK